MSPNKPTILSQYLAMRQNFYDRLNLVEANHTEWLDNYSRTHSSNNHLKSLIDCHLDLSTLRPKLYADKELTDGIVHECIQAFTASFGTERLREEASMSCLVWSA